MSSGPRACCASASAADAVTRTLDGDIDAKAVETHGQVPYGESFTSVALLVVGGPKDVVNMGKRQTITAITIVVSSVASSSASLEPFGRCPAGSRPPTNG
ncbi:hypothetical protein CGZ93_07680 [Enemella dayhoffiae]|uniref:Uncharacterized protein n=1 Tax=Enemella dayhoffiae TaxID=2016507 RepID=A0A255H435_9ACTN|nr:hypothetical protein CGZ93_07680 [Enemella dayhoffiae]